MQLCKLHACAAWVAGVIILTLGTGSVVQAQTVTFSDINDAVPGKYFDAETTAPDPLNPNRLMLGFHMGIDSRLWTYRTFTASTTAFYRESAMDTMRFLIKAPAGFYISKISYTQTGTGSTGRMGRAIGGANWVVDDIASDLGLFGTNPTLSRTIDLTGQNKTVVPVSITNSLFASATPKVGFATISITSAEVLVELQPLLP